MDRFAPLAKTATPNRSVFTAAGVGNTLTVGYTSSIHKKEQNSSCLFFHVFPELVSLLWLRRIVFARIKTRHGSGAQGRKNSSWLGATCGAEPSSSLQSKPFRCMSRLALRRAEIWRSVSPGRRLESFQECFTWNFSGIILKKFHVELV